MPHGSYEAGEIVGSPNAELRMQDAECSFAKLSARSGENDSVLRT